LDSRTTYTTRKPPPPRNRRNRRRKDWNTTIRRGCVVIGFVELAFLLFENPAFWVRNVRVEGLQTLNASQVFFESGIKPRTNIFKAWLHEPVKARLERDPVIERADRLVDFPDTIVLRIHERKPYAVLLLGGRYWLLDPNGIPYRLLAGPLDGLPLLKYVGVQTDTPVTLGRPIRQSWVLESYKLLALIGDRKTLDPQLVTVDQNANLCLNRADNLQIKLGQPDDLPEKLAVAAETLAPGAESRAHNIAYIDVSSPGQPALMLRREGDSKENGNRIDGHGQNGDAVAPQ
jgi:cell division protein FtsQ